MTGGIKMKFDFFKTFDGVRLGYIDQGSGVPVILIAGYSAPAISWFPQEPALPSVRRAKPRS